MASVTTRLFQTTSILALLLATGCSSYNKDYQSRSVYSSTETNMIGGDSGIIGAVNAWRYYLGRLPSEDRRLQEKAVFYVLENSLVKEGQTVSWHNEKNDTHGFVTYVSGHGTSSRFCKVIETVIVEGTNHAKFKEEACKGSGTRDWVFVERG